MSRELVPEEDIASFYEEGWITEVLHAVKSGKEATVYCAKAYPNRGADFFALKVYAPLAQRNFRDAAVYQEGRTGRKTNETRAMRAMRKKTAKGRGMQFGSWLEHEFATLQTLHAAGADVPEPKATSVRAVLLEFIGEGDQAAPPLHSVRLAKEEAQPLFAQAMRNIELMLACDLVHGDLSPYNILYVAKKLCVIDFPQAVDPRFNNNARALLERDVTNVCRYFQRQGVTADPVQLTEELWERYIRARL